MELNFKEKEQNKEKAVLIAVDNGQFDAEVSIAELSELAKTAGAQVVGEVIQRRNEAPGVTFLGKGRVEELAQFCQNENIDLIIADAELSPVQVRNLEDLCGVPVVDRTTLILDIFASRAKSGEGKLQVELAQLQYNLPRLSGKGTSLSRLGGGIGTRGPGETQLETDRRHIRRRITSLKEQLDSMEKRRTATHERRKKNGALIVAIVGYTNAGKSTLMNRLTDAGVLQEDKLFATLDPTARKLTLPDTRQVMLIDTVGLVRRLPHQLVNAFRSTLEEAVWADVILNVCDISSPEAKEQIEVTDNLLAELGCGDKSILHVYNKSDLLDKGSDDLPMGKGLYISAKSGEGINELLQAISLALPQTIRRAKMQIPFDMGAAAGELRKNGTVHSESFSDSGVLLDVTAKIQLIEKYKSYII